MKVKYDVITLRVIKQTGKPDRYQVIGLRAARINLTTMEVTEPAYEGDFISFIDYGMACDFGKSIATLNEIEFRISMDVILHRAKWN